MNLELRSDGSYSVPQAAVRELYAREPLASNLLIDRPFPARAPLVLVPLREAMDGEPVYELPRGCADLLARHGLRPWLIAPGWNGSLADAPVSGVLYVGGDDIDPASYGAESHARTRAMERRRDALELHLLRQAVFPRSLPFLGICRGVQALAVSRDGTLHQHLPDLAGDVEHWANPWKPGDATHTVFLDPDSRCSRILGTGPVVVNSHHHQAVDRPGRGLRVAGVTSDGVVEILERDDPRHWCVGVQSHPERDPRMELELLIADFVRACRNR